MLLHSFWSCSTESSCAHNIKFTCYRRTFYFGKKKLFKPNIRCNHFFHRFQVMIEKHVMLLFDSYYCALLNIVILRYSTWICVYVLANHSIEILRYKVKWFGMRSGKCKGKSNFKMEFYVSTIEVYITYLIWIVFYAYYIIKLMWEVENVFLTESIFFFFLTL